MFKLGCAILTLGLLLGAAPAVAQYPDVCPNHCARKCLQWVQTEAYGARCVRVACICSPRPWRQNPPY
jgi:hypothetical protein